MADISIDTSSPQYVQLLSGLETLRTILAPRIRILQRCTRETQRQWLQRDPLLRRTIILAQSLSELVEQELSE